MFLITVGILFVIGFIVVDVCRYFKKNEKQADAIINLRTEIEDLYKEQGTYEGRRMSDGDSKS